MVFLAFFIKHTSSFHKDLYFVRKDGQSVFLAFLYIQFCFATS